MRIMSPNFEACLAEVRRLSETATTNPLCRPGRCAPWPPKVRKQEPKVFHPWQERAIFDF